MSNHNILAKVREKYASLPEGPKDRRFAAAVAAAFTEGNPPCTVTPDYLNPVASLHIHQEYFCVPDTIITVSGDFFDAPKSDDDILKIDKTCKTLCELYTFMGALEADGDYTTFTSQHAMFEHLKAEMRMHIGAGVNIETNGVVFEFPHKVTFEYYHSNDYESQRYAARVLAYYRHFYMEAQDLKVAQ